MKKYIHAYILNGQTLFTQLMSWSDIEIGNNKPMKITCNVSEEGYENITNIENIEKYIYRFEICKQLNYIIQEETFDWNNLNNNEKKILSKYFLVEKTLRDEVLTEQEQEDNNYFRIYNLLSRDYIETNNISNPFLTPKSIDYKKAVDGNLHPKYIFDNHGWLVECIYYRDLSIWQNQLGFTQYDYSYPVLHYTANYTIKDDGYVGSRIVTRKWYKLDGTLDDDAKITEKFYEPMNARNEGKRRRTTLINLIIIQTVGLFIMTSPDLNNVTEAEEDAIPFMREVANGISEYYEYGTKRDNQGNPCKLIQDVMNSQYSRLNNFVPGTNNTVTIRQFIISKLDV